MRPALLALCLLLPAAAWAQEPPPKAPPVDPRLAGPLMQALQAQVELQRAMMAAQHEDAEAQKATLWQWFLAAKGAKDAK